MLDLGITDRYLQEWKIVLFLFYRSVFIW